MNRCSMNRMFYAIMRLALTSMTASTNNLLQVPALDSWAGGEVVADDATVEGEEDGEVEEDGDD